jgi:hypothetical protein
MRIGSSAVLVVLSMWVGTSSALSDTQTGTAQVTVVRALSITPNRATLNFGILIRPPAGTGTATIDTTGTGGIAVAGGVALMPSNTHNNADFLINGEGGQLVFITVDPAFTMNGPAGSTLTVNTSAANAGLKLFDGSLGGANVTPIDVVVGGAITIPSNQHVGAYNGSFNVTAVYN